MRRAWRAPGVWRMGRSWAGCCRLPASVYRRRRETRRVEEGVAVLARMRAWRNGSGAEEVVRGAWDVGVCWARSYGVGLMRCGSPRYGCVLFFSCSPPRRWLLRVAAPAPASVASCRRRLPRQGIEKGRRHPTRRGHAWPHRGTYIMVGAAAAALSLCAVVAMSRCSPRLPPPPASIAAAVHFYRPSSHLLVQTLPPTLLALTSLRAHPNPTNRAARRPPPPRPSTYTQHSQPGSARPPRHSPGSGGHGGSPTSSQPAAPPGHPRAAAAAGARTPPAGPYLPPAVAAS